MSTCKHNDHSHILLYVYLFMVWMFSGSKDVQDSQARRIERLESEVAALRSRTLESELSLIRLKVP